MSEKRKPASFSKDYWLRGHPPKCLHKLEVIGDRPQVTHEVFYPDDEDGHQYDSNFRKAGWLKFAEDGGIRYAKVFGCASPVDGKLVASFENPPVRRNGSEVIVVIPHDYAESSDPPWTSKQSDGAGHDELQFAEGVRSVKITKKGTSGWTVAGIVAGIGTATAAIGTAAAAADHLSGGTLSKAAKGAGEVIAKEAMKMVGLGGEPPKSTRPDFHG